MNQSFSLTELEAYLDEALPAGAMAEVEKALRSDESLAGLLADINGRRDAGVHSLGGVWRRARLSCPSREQLGSYLLEALPDGAASYVPKTRLAMVSYPSWPRFRPSYGSTLSPQREARTESGGSPDRAATYIR